MTFTKLGRDVQTQQVVQVGFDERKSHIDIMGGTGTGKTTLLIDIALQDIHQEKAGAFFDPHGGAIRAILKRAKKTDKLFWLDPNEENFPAMNLLYCSDMSDSQQVDASVSFALRIFKRLWKINEDTPNLEIILKCCFITLIYNKKTLDFLPDLIKDANLRNQMIAKIPTAHRFAKWFWEDDFNKWPPTEKTRRTESTLNKVLAFLTNSTVAKIVSKEGLVDFTSALKDGHFFLFRMNPKRTGKKGGIEEDGVRYVGSILMALFVDTAMRRDEGERDFFSLILDEFHRFATDEFQFILAELRQYGVAVTLAYQYKGQLDLSLVGAVEQTSIKVVFRVNKKEAEDSAPLFADDSPPREMRIDKILRPAAYPIESLLSVRGSQDNPIVDQFTHLRLTVFADAIKNSHVGDGGMTKWGKKTIPIPVSDLDIIRRQLNRIFNRVMIEKAFIGLDIETFFPFIEQVFHISCPHILDILTFHSSQFGSFIRFSTLDLEVYRELIEEDLWKVIGLKEIDSQQAQQAQSWYRQQARDLFDKLWEGDTKQLLQQLKNACYHVYVTNSLLIYDLAADGILLTKAEREKRQFLSGQGRAEKMWKTEFNCVHYPLWEEGVKRPKENSEEYRQGLERYKQIRLDYYYQLWKDQEEKRGKFRQDFQQRIRAIVDPMNEAITTELRNIEQAVQELKQFMQALIDDPILEVSRLIEIPGLRENPQYTITDRGKELLNLETGVAWCRIIEEYTDGRKRYRIKKHKIEILDLYPLVVQDDSQRLQEMIRKTQQRYGDDPPTAVLPTTPPSPPGDHPRSRRRQNDII